MAGPTVYEDDSPIFLSITSLQIQYSTCLELNCMLYTMKRLKIKKGRDSTIFSIVMSEIVH